jgi:hypothetical protein
MGAGQSVEGNALFEAIQKCNSSRYWKRWLSSHNVAVGPWSRVAAVLKSYSDEEYDFGIDAHTVASITGLTVDESKQFIKLLSKDKKGLM